MILDLSDDALEYGRQVRNAFDAAGGDELVIQAEKAPSGRESLVGPVLAGLGATIAGFLLVPLLSRIGRPSDRGQNPLK